MNWLLNMLSGPTDPKKRRLLRAGGVLVAAAIGRTAFELVPKNLRPRTLKDRILDYIDNSISNISNNKTPSTHTPLTGEKRQELEKKLNNVDSAIAVAADGTVLFEKNKDTSGNPASMVKIMTMFIAQIAIKIGAINPKDEIILVAEDINDGDYYSSKSGLIAGTKINVRKAMELTGQKSANDTAWALARHIAGTAWEFVEIMNAVAHKLKLGHTNYTTPNGLFRGKNKNQLATVADTAKLVRFVLKTEPDLLLTYCADDKLVWKKTGTGTAIKTEEESMPSLVSGYYTLNIATSMPDGTVIVVMGAKDEAGRYGAVRAIAAAISSEQEISPVAKPTVTAKKALTPTAAR